MKAFHFRLEQALHWRAAQLDIEKGRTAAIVKRLTEIRDASAVLSASLTASTSELGLVSDGATLGIHNAWTGKTRRQIAELGKLAQRTEKDLAAQTTLMLEANRRCKLIENLKHSAQAEWRSELMRELEAFAGETYLGRLQSKKRARSSGG